MAGRSSVERLPGSLFAYAVDRIIEVRVNREGKSPDQVAAEIRSQLEAAGIENPTVEYSESNGETTLRVQMQAMCEEGETVECPDVRIQVDGQPEGDGDRREERHVIKVNRTEGMTDDEIIAEVRRQMREQGMEGDVTIENGQIRITPREP